MKTEIWGALGWNWKRKGCISPARALFTKQVYPFFILSILSFSFEYVPYLFAFHTGGEAESPKSLAPVPSPAPQQSTNNGARQYHHSSRGNKSRPRPSTGSLHATLAPPLPPVDGRQGSSAAKKIGKSAAILNTTILSEIGVRSQPVVLCTCIHNGRCLKFYPA